MRPGPGLAPGLGNPPPPPQGEKGGGDGVKRSLMVVLGLLPENEGLSRKVQRIWFAAPVLGWGIRRLRPRERKEVGTE